MQRIRFEDKAGDFTTIHSSALYEVPHFHKHLELIYVVSGQATAYADQKKSVLHSGDLYIAFPNQIHYYEKSVTGKYVVVLLSPELIYGVEDMLYNNIPKKNLLTKDKVQDCVKIIMNYAQAKGAYAATAQVGLANQLLATLLPKLELAPRIKTNNTTLQSVLNYCSKNFANDLTLDTLAQDLHISKFHISHLLNQKLGISFNAYLSNIRVRNACYLLEDRSRKIADISEEIGFGSIRSFNRAFKEIMGVTPVEYRSKL